MVTSLRPNGHQNGPQNAETRSPGPGFFDTFSLHKAERGAFEPPVPLARHNSVNSLHLYSLWHNLGTNKRSPLQKGGTMADNQLITMLMFTGEAEAIAFYTGLFDDSSVEFIEFSTWIHHAT